MAGGATCFQSSGSGSSSSSAHRAWNLALLLALALLCGLPAAASPRRPPKVARLVLRYLYLKNCAGSDAYATLTGHAIHQQRDGGQLTDANVTLTKVIRSIRSMEVKINRCRDVVSHATCEYFTTWSWKTGMCRLITMPNMMWSQGMKSIEPRVACPVAQGLYMLRNATWDVNHPTFRNVFEGYVWTGTFSVRDQDDRTAICLDGGMQGIKARRVD